MFYQDQLCVVTGPSGFVGTHMVKALLSVGARVRAPIHERPMIVIKGDLELVQADLTDQSQCRQVLEGARYVFHCAGAVSAAGVTINNPMSAITANLVLTANILEAGLATGVERMLIFGSSTGYPASSHPIREEEMWDGPTHPTYFGYGWMRRYLERMAEFVHQRGVKVALVRPTAIYGRHDNFGPDTSHVIPALIRKAVSRMDPFEVWGTGEEIRDFLHVEDLIQGCLLAMEKVDGWDPVNIGYGQVITIREIVEIILRATGHTGQLVFDASKPTTIPVRMVDISKAKEKLGFEPQISLADGLADTIEWFRATQKV